MHFVKKKTGHGRCRREHDEEHDRVGTAELRGDVRLVVRGPQLRGRAGAHRAAAGAGQQQAEPPSWERWRRRLESIGGGGSASAAVVVRRR